jgi:hypothetical protein
MPIVDIHSIEPISPAKKTTISRVLCFSLAKHLSCKEHKLTPHNFLIRFHEVYGNKPGPQITIFAAETKERLEQADEIAKNVREDLQKSVKFSEEVRVSLLLVKYGYSRG